MDFGIVITFIVSSVILTLSPGPDILYVISQSFYKGKKTGILISLGLTTGLLLHTLLVVLGLSFLIRENEFIFFVLKLIGALYFIYLAIVVYTNRKNRRIVWTIGLEYNSKLKQIKNFTNNISHYIENSENFVVDENFKSFVRLDKFNDSSIDILIYCFTFTNDWDKYLIIKEELAIKIKEEVEKNGLNFAFPSQSIYIEKSTSSL